MPVLTGGCLCGEVRFDVATCGFDTPDAVPPRDHVRSAGPLPSLRLRNVRPMYRGPRVKAWARRAGVRARR